MTDVTLLLTPPAAQALRALVKGGKVVQAGTTGRLWCVWRKHEMVGPAFPADVRDELKAKGFIDRNPAGDLVITALGAKAAK